MYSRVNKVFKFILNYEILRLSVNFQRILFSSQVSNDENAVKLATKYGVKIVVSAKALRSLAGNVGPLFRRSWDIPFTIKEVNFHGKTIRKEFIFRTPGTNFEFDFQVKLTKSFLLMNLFLRLRCQPLKKMHFSIEWL